jgi:excinuclease ABC subunit C
VKKLELSQFKLPDGPGVYFFKRGEEILYIGKATSLQDRVKSYFAKDMLLTRGPKIVKMLEEATKVEFKETDSVLEALILEANEIKKHQPTANSREKDDKSYNFVVITKEDFPRVLIERGKNLDKLEYQALKVFGPFPHGGELREGLKIIRKIFPYRDNKCKITPKLKPCFNAQLGLCPGPCAGWVTKEEYRKMVKHLTLFFEGKKQMLLRDLEKEMKAFAKKQQFEEAEKVKRQLFALDHIQDIALIKHDIEREKGGEGVYRIEAYDIAHLGGKDVVGVMTVVEDGERAPSQYRKFKIKADTNDDVNNLKEVLSRRLNHPEWPLPQLIVVDGGVGQLNGVKEVLNEKGVDIPVVSVVKDDKHKAKGVIGLNISGGNIQENKGREKAILLANAESHRFAIGYHRKLRGKGFRI